MNETQTRRGASLAEMWPPFRAAIFDFDETIVDLEVQHHAASVALCREMGSDYLDLPESFRTSSGRRIVDEIGEMKRLFGWQGSEAEIYSRRAELFLIECRRDAPPLLAGVARTIRALRDAGLAIGVASSGITGSISLVLEQNGLLPAVSAIVGGDDVHRGKPDPEPYLLAASKLSVAPAQCVVFEDSTVGVQSARRAGMFCVAVRNAHAKQRQDLGDAHVELTTLDEIDVAGLLRRDRKATALD